MRALQPQLRAPGRRRGRTHRGGAGRRDEPDHQGVRLQQGLRDRPLHRARRSRAAPTPSPSGRHLRGDRLGHRHHRDRGEAGRHPAAALAACDRARRHRRAGEPHGRALRHGVPPRHRLAALVQRIRAGEDAAQSPRPVDVRGVAGDVPPRRHGAGEVRAGPRHESRDLEPGPQRDGHVQGPGRGPCAHRGGRRSARDRDDAHGDAPSPRAAGQRRVSPPRHGGGDRPRGPRRGVVRGAGDRRDRGAAGSRSTPSSRRRAASPRPSRRRSSTTSGSSRRRSRRSSPT